MAKRFTDTNKYKKPFIRSLPGAYKLLWDFLYHDCDHAGIWIVDFEIAQMFLGKDMPINQKKALELFNSDEQRIVVLDSGKKWFIPSFIDFQYGQLSEKNRAHLSVISILLKHGLIDEYLKPILNKPLTSPLQGAMDKDKDMIMDKHKDKDNRQSIDSIDKPNNLITNNKQTIESEFEHFWSMYKKSRSKPKCFAKWQKLSETEKQKIFETLPEYVKSTPDVKFRKDPLTYLNGECWNDEIISSSLSNFGHSQSLPNFI